MQDKSLQTEWVDLNIKPTQQFCYQLANQKMHYCFVQQYNIKYSFSLIFIDGDANNKQTAYNWLPTSVQLSSSSCLPF